MEYISDKDYNYIMNKYHDQSKPFNGLNRFVRNDELFDENTGLDPNFIIENIMINDEKYKEFSHGIRKAKALEYVLSNTRISCDSRDIFPAINLIDRPLNKTIVRSWHREVFLDIIPEVENERLRRYKDGIASIYVDYDHSVPNFERLFNLGFVGLLEESEKIRNSKERNSEEDAFFESIKISYEAVLLFIKRLYNLASETEGSQKMAKALKTLLNGAPKTFYEAMLLVYLYFMISEHVDSLQVRSLSNFDKYFYKFYLNDLKNGITEDEIRKDLAKFFLQFTAIDNYWNQPVFLGGEYEGGKTIINELSYLFLDVYDKMNIFNPKIQIKLCYSTPKEFTLKALDMIRRGHSSIVFVCEPTIKEALMKRGYTEEQARDCNVKGCFEFSVQESFGCGGTSLNLLKPLEYTLHKGHDAVNNAFSGIESPDLSKYKTFEDFYNEYKRQLKGIIDISINLVNKFEAYLSYINPQSLLAGTFKTSLDLVKDPMQGGSTGNGSGLGLGAIADLVDSLSMIKKYVYDKKELSLTELVNMLDNNFVGNENWLLKLKNDRDKFGNNKDLPDNFAIDIIEYLDKIVRPNLNEKSRGGKWGYSFHVARAVYTLANSTATSPNGRLIGEELSKNFSASMGQNREGATAAILSTTKMDAVKVCGDVPLDLGLLPSAIKGEDGLEAMYGLLMTFLKRKGHAIHFNVFDAETLRDAQKNPEKYQDLQIRVSGWNVLWNNINKVEQDGFIRQAESLI